MKRVTLVKLFVNKHDEAPEFYTKKLGFEVAEDTKLGDYRWLLVRLPDFGVGERVGPGNYVYEPAGTIDGWGAVGDEPCVIHIKVAGVIEYLGDDGQLTETVSAATQRGIYLAWCGERGVRPSEQILADPQTTNGGDQ
jgi:catechol 2,3-dioxygenase-like lactoylglutathione lyase family enzyme